MTKTVEHVNFYENIAEVQIRIVSTVVLYEGRPFFVLCAGDHKKDGIIRLYLDDLSHKDGPAHLRVQVPYSGYGGDSVAQGMDQWLDKNPNEGVIRKMMNSPAFKKFRPFPLGMINTSGRVVYTERNPVRHTFQGLTQHMIQYHGITLSPNHKPVHPQMLQPVFADMILGDYPSLEESIENLLDPSCSNEAVAFHRDMALLKGPMESLYVAYRHDVVGMLPYADMTMLKLGGSFRHLREAIRALNFFRNVE